MLKELIAHLLNLPAFKDSLTEKKVSGLAGSLFSIYTRAIFERHGRVSVITETPYKTHTLLSPLFEDIVSAHQKSPDEEILTFLSQTRNQQFAGVSDYIRDIESPDSFFLRALTISRGETIPFSSIAEKLVSLDYERFGTVTEPGEFALRGGIIDIFPKARSSPVRIEFFGDEVLSIREFDLYTQRSVNEIETVFISPNSISHGTSSILDYLTDMPIITDIEELDGDVIHLNKGGYDVGGNPSYVGSLPLFREKIRELSGYQIFISCEPDLKEEIEILFPNIPVLPLDLIEGFILLEEKLALFSFDDIFGRRRHSRKKRIRDPCATPIEDLEDITRGDYVVHSGFGVGIYSGIEEVNIDRRQTDCLLIKYQDEDKLFVPISQIKSVEKYIGDGSPKRLDSLGDGKWNRKKKKAASEIEKIQKELLLLYAKRRLVKGHSFSGDTVWQKELEAGFPYQETGDQMRVTEEIKIDMESDTPMDRLICGDVGFGKTEIAIRASMKAVMDGKQVAVLVPTTILAEQHFETFRKRFEGLPIIIEQLSSFVTPEKSELIKRRIEDGKIDIIIGTHALLGGRIIWKDLGLLIIDEEHRFGVKDKERIKQAKKGVEVLSLSATPIPRTLFQSLEGIRDISQLSTPPGGRLPIATMVTEWDEGIIRDAVERELQRGGQVYFVHNEIKTIMEVKNRLTEIVHGLRIAVVHGRLPKRRLEERMVQFLHQKSDLLLTTAIIASGIDITNVNTIIVNRAWRFGIADLHQLRGRVGRGDRQAYCYLLKSKDVPPIAMKRLRAVASSTELGAGMRLAMRDLEIRGSGNLLGMKQHGYANSVGYGLYIRLIEETAKRLKGDSQEEEEEPVIDISLSARLPDSYVDREHKLGLYKRLGRVENREALLDFSAELRDRFGPLPSSVRNLIDLVKIKLLAKRAGISKVRSPRSEVQGHGKFLIELDNRKRISLGNGAERYNFTVDVRREKTVINLVSNIAGLKEFLEIIVSERKKDEAPM